MKPGLRVAYVTDHVAVLGHLVQPLFFAGETRWSIDWEDGVTTPGDTWPETALREVMPQ